MARRSPLLRDHEQAEALLETYGPIEPAASARGVGGSPAESTGSKRQDPVRVVQTFGDVDLEYAAIRRGCGLMDVPMRGTIEVTGADRLEFLGRMLTQELKGFSPWHVRASFWLSRRGRVEADLRLIQLPDRLWIDVDVHAAARTLEGLSSFVIAEDCSLADRTHDMHRLALHGPSSSALLAAASEHRVGEEVGALREGRVALVEIAGREVIVDRHDTAGEIGLNLLMPVDAVRPVWERLVEIGCPALEDAMSLTSPPYHMRPIGWAAYNVARIESGTPMYYLDFGPDSLPHETSVMDLRVSFTKGCYLGQEIVARMQALGKPKQVLAAIKLPTQHMSTGADPTADADVPEVLQPITGAAIFLAPEGRASAGDIRPSDGAEPIGAVTSSAVSPMLGGTPICLAMLKTAAATPGRRVLVDVGGGMLEGIVLDGLRAWKR